MKLNGYLAYTIISYVLILIYYKELNLKVEKCLSNKSLCNKKSRNYVEKKS